VTESCATAPESSPEAKSRNVNDKNQVLAACACKSAYARECMRECSSYNCGCICTQYVCAPPHVMSVSRLEKAATFCSAHSSESAECLLLCMGAPYCGHTGLEDREIVHSMELAVQVLPSRLPVLRVPSAAVSMC